MGEQKWTEKKWAKRAGRVALVLWAAGSSILLFGRGLIPVVVGLGAFYLAGGLVVFLIWLVYKLGGGRRKHLPDLGGLGVMVMVAGMIGLLITAIQERVFKFPHKLSDPLFFSNVVIIVVFFLWGRASKKCEEKDDD